MDGVRHGGTVRARYTAEDTLINFSPRLPIIHKVTGVSSSATGFADTNDRWYRHRHYYYIMPIIIFVIIITPLIVIANGTVKKSPLALLISSLLRRPTMPLLSYKTPDTVRTGSATSTAEDKYWNLLLPRKWLTITYPAVHFFPYIDGINATNRSRYQERFKCTPRDHEEIDVNVNKGLRMNLGAGFPRLGL